MDGISMQQALLKAEIVLEVRHNTYGGAEDWYFLKLGDRIIPLGNDKSFADSLVFALIRNACAFDNQKREAA